MPSLCRGPHLTRLLAGAGLLLVVATATGCSGSSATPTTPTTAAASPSPSPSSSSPSTSSTASSSSGGSPTTGRRANEASTYPGGVATVEITAESSALNWHGTLTGTCAENRFGPFPVDIRATEAGGVTYEGHPSLPGTGTFESTDRQSVPRMEGVLISFPKPGSRLMDSVSDSSDYTVTFDNDQGTAGTQVLHRFRYPTTKVETGSITIRWTCA